MQTAIIGASGRLGRLLIGRLVPHGMRVRAVSRNPDTSLADLHGDAISKACADLLHSETLDAAVAGADAVVYAAHGLVPVSRRNHPARVDGAGFRALVDSAVRAQTRHFVYVSSALAGLPKPPTYGRIKFEGEQYLAESGLPYTILRPTMMTDTHALDALAAPLQNDGRVQIFGSGRTELNWVAAADCAAVIAAILEKPAAARTIAIGGRDNLTRMEAIAQIGDALGCVPEVTTVPAQAMKITRALARHINPGLATLYDLMIAEEEAADQPGWRPDPAQDRIGDTRFAAMIEHWAAEQRA